MREAALWVPGGRVLSRGNGQCKGPEAGQYPVCLWNSEEAHVADARRWGQSSQAIQGAQPRVIQTWRAWGELSEAGQRPGAAHRGLKRTASSPFPHHGARGQGEPEARASQRPGQGLGQEWGRAANNGLSAGREGQGPAVVTQQGKRWPQAPSSQLT